MNPILEPYLAPYQRAAAQHGAGFGSLLWASPQTQQVRFDAIRRAAEIEGKSVLDVGCGRGDFLTYLLDHGVRPESYIGIEGVGVLADVAERVRFGNKRIIHADFVRHPVRMFVGSDLVVFSGSLNTLADEEFRETIRHAYQAAGEALIFNFLSDWNLARQDYLYWHQSAWVQHHVAEFCDNVRFIDDYLEGDCTVCLTK